MWEALNQLKMLPGTEGKLLGRDFSLEMTVPTGSPKMAALY
jgi:hypothetical protein